MLLSDGTGMKYYTRRVYSTWTSSSFASPSGILMEPSDLESNSVFWAPLERKTAPKEKPNLKIMFNIWTFLVHAYQSWLLMLWGIRLCKHLYNLFSSTQDGKHNWAILITDHATPTCKKLLWQPATDFVWVTVLPEQCVTHFKHYHIRKICALKYCTNCSAWHHRTGWQTHRVSRD